MATTKLNQKLVAYLQDALAMERYSLRMLASLSSSTNDGEIQQQLERHKTETQAHETLLQQRLEALGAKTPKVSKTGAALAPVLKALGVQMRADNMSSNARDGFALEQFEVATYELLERLAERAGDAETANLARRHRLDEEAMAQRMSLYWDRFADVALQQEGGSRAAKLTRVMPNFGAAKERAGEAGGTLRHRARQAATGVKQRSRQAAEGVIQRATQTADAAQKNPLGLAVGSATVGVLLGRRALQGQGSPQESDAETEPPEATRAQLEDPATAAAEGLSMQRGDETPLGSEPDLAADPPIAADMGLADDVTAPAEDVELESLGEGRASHASVEPVSTEWRHATPASEEDLAP